MTKREPTDYVILMAIGADEERRTPLLARVGQVQAYTPQQARRRAAHLTEVQREAKRRGAEPTTIEQEAGQVAVYAVPERNLNRGVVESFTGTRLKEGAYE